MFGYKEDNQVYTAQMNGAEYKDVNFSLNIEVGSGGMWSESLSIQLLDKMKADQDITTDDYIELYPDSIMTFKAKLKKMRQQKLLKEQQLLQQQLIMKQNQINQVNSEINSMNQGIIA